MNLNECNSTAVDDWGFLRRKDQAGIIEYQTTAKVCRCSAAGVLTQTFALGCRSEDDPKDGAVLSSSSPQLGTRLFDPCGHGRDSGEETQGRDVVTAPLLLLLGSCPVY